MAAHSALVNAALFLALLPLAALVPAFRRRGRPRPILAAGALGGVGLALALLPAPWGALAAVPAAAVGVLAVGRGLG